jgi:MFS family permease
MPDEIGYSTIVKNNIEVTVKEGSINAVKVGAGESFFSAFAIKALNATPAQVGLLSSFPPLLGYISNIFTPKALEKIKSRRKLILLGAFVNAISFIPIFLSIFIKGYEFPFLLLAVTLYFVADLFIVPAWISLMGDIIPDQIKGIYFGERNKITNFVAFVSLILAGFLLQKVSGISLIYAFGIIFFIAMVARLLSAYMYTKVYEPEYYFDESYKFSFFGFLKNLKKTNFGIFVIYMCVFTFSFRIAAPYFSVYMFNYLGFDYLKFTLIAAASTLTTILSMPIWGKYIDEFGNKRIMALTGFCIPLIPLLWMVSNNFLYLFFVEMFSGFVWAGFNLATFNFVFFSTSPEKRPLAYSYYHILIGVSIFIGTMTGSLLIEKVHLFEIPIFNVFVASAILRFLSSLLFLPKIKEPVRKKEISYPKLLFAASLVEIWKSLHHINIIKLRQKKKSFFERLVEELRDLEKS